MKKVTIDYVFNVSTSLLFKRLSSASGLAEWFADDVTVKKGIYSIKWNKNIQQAKVTVDRKNLYVRFDWLDDDKEFFEFKIEKSNMSKDVSLFIVDFVEDDETEEDAYELWNSAIEKLKRKLGMK